MFAHEFHTTKKLHSCKSLHEFLLSDHNQNNEKQLKQHAAAKLKDVDITNFARSIRNLKTRYNNDHKKNKNLTVTTFILQNKQMTIKSLRTSIKRYSKKPKQHNIQTYLSTDMSLAISPIQVNASNNKITNDNNVESLDETYNIDHSQDELLDELINIEDLDLISLPSFDLSSELQDGPSAATSTNIVPTAESPIELTTDTSRRMSARLKQKSSTTSTSSPPTKSSATKQTAATNTPQKRKKKIVEISSSVPRINAVNQDILTSIILQQDLSSLFYKYGKNSDLLQEGFNNQEKIDNICAQLHPLIVEATEDEAANTRNGLQVTKSGRMGFHSKDGPLRGFTITIGGKHYHNCNVGEVEDCKHKIWELGLELWRMKKDNSSKPDESVCMEFGYMLPGDYVEEVKLYYVYIFLY